MKKYLIILSVALLSAGFIANAQTAPDAQGNFTRPDLPYAYNALEPAIDAQTMEIHLTKHHQAYVDKLNAEVVYNDELRGKTLEEILKDASKYSVAVRNNAGGHWNHSFFWKVMAPAKDVGTPSLDLIKAINNRFGSMDKFKEEFEKAGVGRFGSGWAWLIVKADGSLDVTSTPKQDNPLMDAAEIKGTPILGNDLWEHAYYLKYQNKRADYLKAWWQVVNWKQVSDNYLAALKK